MTNHVHLVATPLAEVALARTVQMTQMRHTQRINLLQGMSGHLWQGRFFSCPLDDAHFWTAIRYVEQNPVLAGLVASAADYPWSSAPAHCGRCHDPLLTELPGQEFIADWAAWLAQEDPVESALIRAHTLQGAPCGSDAFRIQLSTQLGRPLILRPRGRPRKTTDEGQEPEEGTSKKGL